MTPLQEITLGEILARTAEKYPNNDALVYTELDYRLTYKQLDELVHRTAKGLMALGIQKGEKLAVWATNIPDWIVLQFATARIGAILLTVNTNYKTHELEYLLQQSECENIALISELRDFSYLNALYELVPELASSPRGDIQSERLPHLKRAIYLSEDFPEGHIPTEAQVGFFTMKELLRLGDSVLAADYLERQESLSPHDVVNMQYTSGTTGFPKGVMLTHYSIGNNGFFIGQNQNFGPEDRLCLPVPLFHCFGCVLGVLASVHHGVAMVVLETFKPVQAMQAIEKERCTALYGVPTMFIAILEDAIFDQFDLSTLRTGIMAGSPCPAPIMRQVMEKMHMREITICYGLTEASPVMTQTKIDDDIRRRTETVGRPMEHVEVKVVDPETGREAPTGVQGEVCCRGYLIMQGYYNMPDATAGAIDADGWLHSGDLGVMDEDGYLAITGRIKDMIIRGGENIYPKEIEDFLYTMDGVFDVQVVGVPSEKYGEEVAAFIIPKEGRALTLEDVRNFCDGRIAWYKTPRYAHFVEKYPMTASGKVQKYLLRQLSAELWPDA